MNLKPLLIIPPLALGVAGFMWMTRPVDKPAPERPEATLAVRVMTVQPEAVAATATGFGRVEPVHAWTAVSEVEGRITALVDGLAEGLIVEQGQLVVQVDRTDYALEIQKSQANIAAAEAALAELGRQVQNSQATLEVEQRILAVAQDEFDRVSRLVQSGTSTQATLDSAQKTLLAQEASVTNLTNTLALYPAQRASAEASLAVRRAELAEAERALEKTRLSAPFRGRVSAADVEVGQFIRTGDQLLTIAGTEAAEVVAEFQPQAFAPLVQTALGRSFDPATEVDASQIATYLNAAGVRATVRMDMMGLEARYDAELVRFRGTIDSGTGTIGIVVRVDNPMVANREKAQPPLNAGSFVAVDLTSTPAEGVVAIPRAAVHLGDDGTPFVYVSDSDDRLQVQPIVTGAVLGDRVMVRDGLIGGERLVLSSPRPPIPGMKLTPVAAAKGN